MGRVERLVGALEQLQVPLAQVREALGIEGMDERDRAQRPRQVADEDGAARTPACPAPGTSWSGIRARRLAFADAVGFPLVAKPPAGAGAQATYRLDDAGDAARLAAARCRRARTSPALLEEFLVGEEHTFDSVTVGGETVWASISDYQPPPLEVLRNPWMQWTVLLPRDIDGPEYDGIQRVGPAALRALGVTDAFTHMEWFRRPDGSVAVSEVAARPPGRPAELDARLRARLRLLQRLGRAGDPRDASTRPPRLYATGTAYLRGQGRGRVRTVHGVEAMQRQIGHLVVEAKLPAARPAGRVGLPRARASSSSATPTPTSSGTPCGRISRLESAWSSRRPQ